MLGSSPNPAWKVSDDEALSEDVAAALYPIIAVVINEVNIALLRLSPTEEDHRGAIDALMAHLWDYVSEGESCYRQVDLTNLGMFYK